MCSERRVWWKAKLTSKVAFGLLGYGEGRYEEVQKGTQPNKRTEMFRKGQFFFFFFPKVGFIAHCE